MRLYAPGCLRIHAITGYQRRYVFALFAPLVFPAGFLVGVDVNRPTHDVTDIRPSLATWAAWVDSVGGQWISEEDLALIGHPDNPAPTVGPCTLPAKPQ